jgi:4-coumarate--CoA ligase
MGQALFCVSAPQQGVPVYIMPKFDFLKVLEAIQRFRITSLSLVPPIAVALAKHPAVKKFDLSSIEGVGAGAAPLGREISAEVERLWPPGKINMKQGWGMTE